MKRKNTKSKIKLSIIFIIIFVIIGYLVNEIDVDIGQEQSTIQTTTEQQTQTSLNQLSDYNQLKVNRANVYIQTNYQNGYEYGSGVIIASDDTYYYAITNYHVIDGNMNVIDNVIVKTFDDISSTYEIVSYDNELDLALIKFEKLDRASIDPLSIKVDDTQVNDIVIAVGNPTGQIGTMTYGFIESITTLKELELTHQVYEHNAPLYYGSSGGALIDLNGNLIGINTWTLNESYYSIRSSVIYNFVFSYL